MKQLPALNLSDTVIILILISLFISSCGPDDPIGNESPEELPVPEFCELKRFLENVDDDFINADYVNYYNVNCSDLSKIVLEDPETGHRIELVIIDEKIREKKRFAGDLLISTSSYEFEGDNLTNCLYHNLESDYNYNTSITYDGSDGVEIKEGPFTSSYYSFDDDQNLKIYADHVFLEEPNCIGINEFLLMTERMTTKHFSLFISKNQSSSLKWKPSTQGSSPTWSYDFFMDCNDTQVDSVYIDGFESGNGTRNGFRFER